ncbi:protein translocase SEC61 complex subunit gamma [Candidatus Woesearchaeota archaeon]|nr:MAG: protein translocase SEC61 complex subunit gamma [Candidatus Woesearchaeota archaeon]
MQVKSFITQCIRVLRVTKRPSWFEFQTIVKVAGLGMVVIGLIGFLLHLIRYGIFGSFLG